MMYIAFFFVWYRCIPSSDHQPVPEKTL